MDFREIYAIPGFQEPVSCWSHLLTAPLFAILGCLLVQRGRPHRGHMASLAVLALASVFLLSMSGVYHLLGPGSGRYVLAQLDVAGVFLLIAGTVTPVHAILFRGFNRWAPLLLIWATAAAGITLRVIFSDRLPPGVWYTVFLVMGWGGFISFILLWRRYGFSFVSPLLWGGVAYTVGVGILALKWPTLIPGVVGPHEMWHLAVLLGLSLHWKFVFRFAGGPPAAQSALACVPS